MSDSRSGHDLNRGVGRATENPNEAISREGGMNAVTAIAAEGEEPAGRPRMTIREAMDANPATRELVKQGSGAGATGTSPRSGRDSGNGALPRDETAVPESNEPFAWTGTWDEAAAERDRLRTEGEDTSDIQAWLNSNEPEARREERLNAQQAADDIEPTNNEDPSDTQIAQELVEGLSGGDSNEGDNNANSNSNDNNEPPPESGLGVRLEDSIRRVLSMDGGRGSAAIGSLALVVHTLQEGIARGMQGEPVGIPSILEMALEDYRARRDRIELAAAEQRAVGDIQVDQDASRQQTVGDIQVDQAIREHEGRANIDQEFQREIMEAQQAFDLKLRDIDFGNEQQRMILAQQMNVEMARIEQTIGLENFSVQQRETWDQTKREIQYMAENNGRVARAANAQSGVSSAQATFNNVSAGLATAGKILGSMLQ